MTFRSEQLRADISPEEAAEECEDWGEGDPDEYDMDDDSYCECGAVHSIQETDDGWCGCCGGEV